jgi:cysteine synthase A
MIYDQVSCLNIDDVFVRLAQHVANVDVFVKVESLNFANSVKLKAAVAMIGALEAAGKLYRGAQVVESSSGNLGVALAMVCAERGYRFTCVTDPNVSPHNLLVMRAYGAKVIMVEHMSGGGFVQERLRVIRQLLDEHPDMVWTDQYSNPENPRIHHALTAPAILRNVPDVTHVFLGVGSSGTFIGCAEYFAEHKPDVRLVAVDPQGSVLFGQQAQRRYVPGIGGSVLPPIFKRQLAHDFVIVPESDTLLMCEAMARERGWLIGGSTGTSLAAIRQYAPKLPAGSRVVTIAPDFGNNYMDTVYRPSWVEDVLADHKRAAQL